MTIGKTIRKARESRNITREQLAKRLKISASYLAQLECDSHSRHVSERLEAGLKRVLKTGAPAHSLVESHNTKVRKWYRVYLAKYNKAKKSKAAKRTSKKAA
jgi:transcriptional regulator with XRE-family HTH domain